MSSAYQRQLGHLADAKLAKKLGHNPPRKLGGLRGARPEKKMVHRPTPWKPPVPPAPQPVRVWTNEEKRVAAGRATQRLWQSVIDSLEFRHPNLNAKTRFSWLSDTRGRFTVVGVNESRSDTHFPISLEMNVGFPSWPGRHCAEIFLVAAWTHLMAHEATELVNHKNKRVNVTDPTLQFAWPGPSRVLDPHGITRESVFATRKQAKLFEALEGRSTYYDGVGAHVNNSIEVMLAHLLGEEHAKNLLLWEAPAAQAEHQVLSEKLLTKLPDRVLSNFGMTYFWLA